MFCHSLKCRPDTPVVRRMRYRCFIITRAVMMASANAVTTGIAKAAAAVAKALADDVGPSGPGPSVLVKFEVDDDGFVGVNFGVVEAPPAPRVR